VEIAYWICLAPIWVLSEHFNLLEAYGVRRIVALSSTSRFTKDRSSDLKEQVLAGRFTKAEEFVTQWAENSGIEWVILRPTLIYGLGRDKNITEIARFIHRFGFFPRFGKALGLRQPIHVQDVATACIKALHLPISGNKAYNISGAETITYRDMVTRIFNAMGRNPLMLPVPLVAFRMAVALLRCLPRYRNWSVAMAERMNNDMVFDHSDAELDLTFKPRAFMLTECDLKAL
jgi:nucleoside-diphosphate-sugar epimerase